MPIIKFSKNKKKFDFQNNRNSKKNTINHEMVLQLTNSSYHEIEKAIVVLFHPTAFFLYHHNHYACNCNCYFVLINAPTSKTLVGSLTGFSYQVSFCSPPLSAQSLNCGNASIMLTFSNATFKLPSNSSSIPQGC